MIFKEHQVSGKKIIKSIFVRKRPYARFVHNSKIDLWLWEINKFILFEKSF